MRFGIALPVHDEEQLLPASLAALSRAIDHVSDVPVVLGIAVVLDACTDRSHEIVTSWQRENSHAGDLLIEVTETDVGNVGQARRIGIDLLLSSWADVEPADIWLATTDADSEVPQHWISSQLAVRTEGGQVWAGGVSVSDWSDRMAGTAALWVEQYEAESLPVHGANFGIEAVLYLEAGGFDPLPTGEDRDLFDRTVALGAVIGHDPGVRVVTSSRREARAPRGFAHALTSLEALLPPDTQVERSDQTGIDRLDLNPAEEV